jgi:hypothetical protein
VATARERLLQALTAIISQPFSEDGKASLNRLLNCYRVQAKPGEHLNRYMTARDALASKIIDIWKRDCPTGSKDMSTTISQFRMQLKQGLSRGKLHEAKQDLRSDQEVIENSKGLTRSQIKENISKHENAYFKEKREASLDIMESMPIAGGPKQRSSTRGQCPKCRSMGIVLARAYGGEDYYSCIYCGYQAYLKGADPKLDLPLAAELLGSAFGDPESNDE